MVEETLTEEEMTSWVEMMTMMSSDHLGRAHEMLFSAIMEVRRHRSAVAADEARVRSVVAGEVRDAIDESPFIQDIKEQIDDAITDVIALRAAKQLATAAERLELTDSERQVLQWMIDDAPAVHRGDLIRRVCRKILIATRAAKQPAAACPADSLKAAFDAGFALGLERGHDGTFVTEEMISQDVAVRDRGFREFVDGLRETGQLAAEVMPRREVIPFTSERREYVNGVELRGGEVPQLGRTTPEQLADHCNRMICSFWSWPGNEYSDGELVYRVALGALRRMQQLATAAVRMRDGELRGLQLMRRHLDEGGHDWRDGTAMADVQSARELIDRLRKGA